MNLTALAEKATTILMQKNPQLANNKAVAITEVALRQYFGETGINPTFAPDEFLSYFQTIA